MPSLNCAEQKSQKIQSRSATEIVKATDSRVQIAMNQIRHMIECLAGQVEHLECELLPVLGPATEDQCGINPSCNDSVCPLENNLRIHAAVIEDLGQRLVKLRERLAI